MSASDGDDSKPRPDRAPSSRFGRLARLTALAPRALPLAFEGMKRAVGANRDEEDPRAAKERMLATAKKTADAMLKTLGEMKGLPLKFGQMASYIDGIAPPGYEEKFKETLKKLQAKAPPLSPEAAVNVIRSDLGAPPAEIYAQFEADPFAAASIGQVHRAVTKAGDAVAVKVQYPGIDKAIENDLKSLSMLETMIAPVGRRYHTKETLDEVKRVFLAELDYTHEAETCDLFRKIHAGDEAIVIPRVHHSLTTRRVLTLQMIDGVDYATFCERGSPEEKRLAAETIWRFMFRALYRHGVLYADPHPGNYRFLGGGNVAFLDFGCSKILPPELIAGMRGYVTAAQDERWDDFDHLCETVLGYDKSDPEHWQLLTDYTRLLLKPLTTDAPFAYTPEVARETVTFLVRGGKKVIFRGDDAIPTMPKPIDMPSDFTFVNRLQWGLASVLAGLGAESNWRRISEPWLRGPYLPPP